MLDGYALTVTAHPISYHWSFGDGGSTTSESAQGPEGEAAASVSHTYTEKGTYDVAVSVLWTGVMTLTFDGNVVSQRDLGQYLQPQAARPYEVQEVRSVLVGG